MTDTRERILALEASFWDAAGDATIYRTHMAEEGLGLFSFGIVDKAAMVESVDGAEPWGSYEWTDVTLLHPSDEVVVLTYRAEGRRDGEDPYVATVCTTYVYRDDDWRLLTHQQTQVGHA